MQDTNKYKVYKAITAVGKWLLFAIVSFLILFPVLWIFVSSITPPGELFKMPIDYIPDHPTLESYKFLIENVGLLEKIGNTVLIVGVTIVVSTVVCAINRWHIAQGSIKFLHKMIIHGTYVCFSDNR